MPSRSASCIWVRSASLRQRAIRLPTIWKKARSSGVIAGGMVKVVGFRLSITRTPAMALTLCHIDIKLVELFCAFALTGFWRSPMARIPDAEIERLRKEASVARLVEASGVALEQRGKDWAGRCPFHAEETASLVIT